MSAKNESSLAAKQAAEEDWSFLTSQEREESKFMTKAKNNPFYPIGIAGGIGALGYMIYKFKNRGDTKLSVYLIHTRLAVQGTVIGAITIGLAYTMVQEHIEKSTFKKR